jgi:hypothetical protein
MSTTGKYGVRYETNIGELEDAHIRTDSKRLALKAARYAAKTTICADVVRVHVDNMLTDTGVAAFKVTSRRAA